MYQYYWRFAQLINNMNVIYMSMRPVQVNTKFLNSLPPEWSKFVMDVKLARDLNTSNYDQLYPYLEQHEAHANETRLMRERYQDPLAFVANYNQSPSQLNNYHSQYNSTQFHFVEPPSEEEMVPFIKELGYNGKCDMLSEIHTDHMHQPWRTFTAVINRCISGKSPDFMFQADNKEISSARKENMPYPRFTKVIISLLISKDKTISMRNKINLHTIRAIKDSKAYKIYLAYATGAANPKKARKFKKPASHSKKKTFVKVKEEELEPTKKDKPTKKPTTKRQSSGVQIQDTPGVSVSKKKTPVKVSRRKGIELLSDATLLEEARSKKALRRSKRETTIIQAGGSSEGADFESVVPDEPKVKTSLVDNGDDDDSNDDDSNDDVSDDEDVLESDDDHEEADDERIESDDEEEEAQDDEYVHTPKAYAPTDEEINDESKEFDEEEYEELYGDVNISLTGAEPTDEEKADQKMTNTKTVDVEPENVNLEGACNQVKDDAHPTQKTEIPILSSSISSDYAA
ncbi:hypothetical protein Tco_1388405, partial [Tanacetum coccineum]